jgi:hypothetical protein
MTDSAKEAEVIYDSIRAISADRPFAFQSVEQRGRNASSRPV